MKTDALLDALALDVRPSRSWRPASSLPAGLFGAALSLAGLLATLGTRPDLMVALADPRVVYKFALAVAAAFAGVILVLRLVRPDGGRGFWTPIALLSLLAAVALVADLAATPSPAWIPALMGDGPWKCLSLMLALAAPPGGLLFCVLRRGAPSCPTKAGTAVGLVAGAAAAAIFALNCQNDSAIFVSVWYGLAIALAAAIGGLVGRRVLAW